VRPLVSGSKFCSFLLKTLHRLWQIRRLGGENLTNLWLNRVSRADGVNLCSFLIEGQITRPPSYRPFPLPCSRVVHVKYNFLQMHQTTLKSAHLIQVPHSEMFRSITNSVVKVNLSLCFSLTEHHATMKVYWGRGGTVSTILDLGTRWR
jgi:hypothetical protein